MATGKKAASSAGKTLGGPGSKKDVKRSAASDLSQRRQGKRGSKK